MSASSIETGTRQRARIDHLVIVAASLEEGVAWCEATLGVTPGPGGEHPLMGTHNRLLRIATVDFPLAYLEIIAINPVAPRPQPERARRWFDMDDAALAKRIATSGPQLIHFVASVPDVAAAVTALVAHGIDRGAVIDASRMSPRGLLRWRITVREDGKRLFDGALPTLIEWGDLHPVTGMPSAGITLRSLVVSHPQAAALRSAHEAIGLAGVGVIAGAAGIVATLGTPRGPIRLTSARLS